MSAPTASCLPSTKAKEAVRYVIGTVLDFNPVDDCPLWLALINDATDESRINLYNQWLWLTPDDILTLQYCPEPGKQKMVPLSRGYHTHVTRFKAIYSELQCTPGWTDLDIFKITYDEYMAFSRQYMAGQITSNPLSPAPNSYASSTDPVALFTKSIKREPKDFPVIKSLNQWDSVKRAVNATATVQSIAEVLNHTYIPSVEDKPLFDLKNSYWYKVLVDIIQELSLRAIVNAGLVGDGQTVWTNIVTEAEKSTTARISLQSLTAYLTTSKICDGSWRGTDTAYLNHWNEQMRKLVEYSPTTPMTDDFKLTLLKNAVQDAPHLASVESAYDVTTRLGSGTPGAIDNNGNMEVLISAAQNHDAKISPTTRSQNRCANAHSSFPTESYDEEQYNIDTSIDTIWVNAHNTVLAHHSSGTRESEDAWSKLNWLAAVDANNQRIQRRSQGLPAGLDCWRNRYLQTYLYFDDSFLRENYYRRLPTIGLATGILWYAHRTPSTIYAMARAIIQLCPHSPTAPLPYFQSLSPEQKEGIYQHVEEGLKPGSVNRVVNWHHYIFAHEALACRATGPVLQPRRDRSYEVFGEEYWVYHLPATVCQYQ
jgi:hypothetical protein